MGAYDEVYTVYECHKCSYYYKTSHSYVCPHCGGRLGEAMCIPSLYRSALP